MCLQQSHPQHDISYPYLKKLEYPLCSFPGLSLDLEMIYLPFKV